MRKPIIKIGLAPQDYAGWISLGNRLISSLTGNVNFATPAVTLLILQGAITAVEDAFALWAPEGNRGTHSDLVDLRDKLLTLRNLINAEADYVQTTSLIAGGNDYSLVATIMTTSGFAMKADPTPQGVLNSVEGFKKVNSSNLNPNQVKFRWKRPLGTSIGNVYLYRVLRGSTAILGDATEIATTSRTEFIETNETATVQTYTYWIVPVNNLGDGAASAAVTVSILS